MKGRLLAIGKRLGRILGWIAAGLLWLWALGAWWFCLPLPSPLGPIVALLLAAGLIVLAIRSSKRESLRWLAIYFLLGLLWMGRLEPRLDADWAPDLDRLAAVSWKGDLAIIDGIRDAQYTDPETFKLQTRIEQYDLQQLVSIDLIVERFHSLDALGHTLLSFGFADGRHLAISAEIRRERDEEFDPIAGLYRQFELVYVLGTEQDLIGLRTNHRKSRVWLYPMKTTPERMRALLRAMLERAMKLATKPEFYNTLTSTCTTNIVDHVLDLKPERIPFDWRTIFPGHAGELAHEIELIDSDLSFDAIQEAYRIDGVAQEAPVGRDFSKRIRAQRPKGND